jgi:hypothetical protein
MFIFRQAGYVRSLVKKKFFVENFTNLGHNNEGTEGLEH